MITLTGITAMRLWAHKGLLARLGDPCRSSGLSWTTGSFKEIRESGLESIGVVPTVGDPVHVLVDDQTHRLGSKRVKCHVWSGRLPAGSLYQLMPGVLITSPAFCCLQSAFDSSCPRAVATMMECLGTYGKVTSTRGFLDRDSLLTRDELAGYIESARGCRGVKNARRGGGRARGCARRTHPPKNPKQKNPTTKK